MVNTYKQNLWSVRLHWLLCSHLLFLSEIGVVEERHNRHTRSTTEED